MVLVNLLLFYNCVLLQVSDAPDTSCIYTLEKIFFWKNVAKYQIWILKQKFLGTPQKMHQTSGAVGYGSQIFFLQCKICYKKNKMLNGKMRNLFIFLYS